MAKSNVQKLFGTCYIEMEVPGAVAKSNVQKLFSTYDIKMEVTGAVAKSNVQKPFGTPICLRKMRREREISYSCVQ